MQPSEFKVIKITPSVVKLNYEIRQLIQKILILWPLSQATISSCSNVFFFFCYSYQKDERAKPATLLV
jgi:hypothetical protein